MVKSSRGGETAASPPADVEPDAAFRGPFLWFRPGAPPRAFRRVPPAGFCISVFVVLTREGRLFLGKYADHAAWEELTGMDAARVRAHGRGWTLPASHMKLGESPRAAAERVLRNVLLFTDPLPVLEGPRVETSYGPHPHFPDDGDHYDMWFLFSAELGQDAVVPSVPWYRELAWRDPHALAPSEYGRCHDEIVDAYFSIERDHQRRDGHLSAAGEGSVHEADPGEDATDVP